MGLRLKIVTPEKVAYDGEADRVVVPGTKGNFEILTGHAPIISSLQSGNVEYVTVDGKASLAVTGGFVEVQKNVVNVCVETA